MEIRGTLQDTKSEGAFLSVRELIDAQHASIEPDLRGAYLEGIESPDGVDFFDWLRAEGVSDARGLVGL